MAGNVITGYLGWPLMSRFLPAQDLLRQALYINFSKSCCASPERFYKISLLFYRRLLAPDLLTAFFAFGLEETLDFLLGAFFFGLSSFFSRILPTLYLRTNLPNLIFGVFREIIVTPSMEGQVPRMAGSGRVTRMWQ
jgi:hypothetical protein